MADTEQQVVSNTDQQVTSKNARPKTKKPKTGRCGANLSRSERELLVRAQRKAVIEAQSIIAQAKPPAENAQAKQADPVADTPSAEPTKNVLATTQWLSIISIVVSLAGVYYKREEIRNVLAKKPAPPSPVLPRAPPTSPRAPTARMKQMD